LFAERLGCTSANGNDRRITFVTDVAAIPVVSADGHIVCTAYFVWNGDAAWRADAGADSSKKSSQRSGLTDEHNSD
jgi:hypothetical protein